MSRRLYPLLIALAPLLLGAAPPLQEPESNALADWMAAQWNELIIEAMKALATLCWFLEKAAAGITRFLTNEDMWDLIIDTTLGSLSGFMPGVLENLVLGSSGMFYLALMLAGLFMIIPNVSSARLVESSRVMVWGVILASLFILGTMGYDLIGYAEDIRAYAAEAVIAEASGGDNLDSLVAVPMRATEGDLGDYGFTLPDAFEAEFFPEPTEFEERTVFNLGGSFLTWEWNILVESEASQQYRRDQAETGLAIAGLTIVAGWALLLLGLIFATLTAAAIVLIIFFVVALPLGFFEFGASILAGIVKQYAYLFAVTLLAVGLAGILAGAGWAAFSDPNPGPSEIMDFVPILIIVAIATGYVMSMATSALTSTMGIISTSIRTSMAPLSYAGTLPAAGGIPGASALSGAASLAITAGGAAMTGGASLAATAVAGKALNMVSSGAGGGAASLARAAGNSTQHHVFATAAAGYGPSRVAAVGLRHQRQQREKETRAATKAYSGAAATGSALPSSAWEGAVDAGGYLTADMRQIEAAEMAYAADERVTARRHLQSAFGDRESAEAALALYDAGDASRVRRIVHTTQAVASDLAFEGELPFDAKGKATPRYQARVQAALGAEKLTRPRDATDSAHVGRIAGATVRRPVGLWQAPDAPRQMAQAVLNEDAPPLTGGDLSAQMALRQMAERHDWDEAQMEALFEGTRQAQSTRPPDGQSLALFATEQLNRQGEWGGVPLALKREAVSNALLMTEQAQLQQAVAVAVPASAQPDAAEPTTQREEDVAPADDERGAEERTTRKEPPLATAAESTRSGTVGGATSSEAQAARGTASDPVPTPPGADSSPVVAPPPHLLSAVPQAPRAGAGEAVPPAAGVWSHPAPPRAADQTTADAPPEQAATETAASAEEAAQPGPAPEADAPPQSTPPGSPDAQASQASASAPPTSAPDDEAAEPDTPTEALSQEETTS